MRQVKKTPRLTALAALGACLLALGPGAIPAAADAPAGDDAISEAGLGRFVKRKTGNFIGPSQPPRVTMAEIVDAFVLRPLGALSTLVGAGFFVATLPITTATNQIQTAKEVLIDAPFQDSFGHPMGAL